MVSIPPMSAMSVAVWSRVFWQVWLCACVCVCVCPFVKVCQQWVQPQECPAYFASQKLYTEYPYAQCMEYLPTFTQQMAQFCR